MKKIYMLLSCLVILSAPGISQAVHQVVATNFAFTPNNFSAVVGDTIRFVYGSGFPHTTTSSSVPAGAATWDDSLNVRITVYKYVVTVPGTYSYICRPHLGAGMVGQFTVSTVLPIKMTSFSSSFVDGKPKIFWQTANEENADHFSIQQSLNGVDFVEIGTLPATGNSQSTVRYSYTVNTLPASAAYLYFRILTVDKNKKEQYSDIILLHLPTAAEANFVKKMYPNPAENGDHIHFDFNAENNGKLDVTIFETTGKQLFNMAITAVEGVNQTHMPLPKLRKGNYYVQLRLEGKKQTLPLFVK